MRDVDQHCQSNDPGNVLVLNFMQHKTAKNRKAAIAVVSGLGKEALFYYVNYIQPCFVPPTFKLIFFSNYLKEMSYANLNKDLTRMYKIAYPDSNYTITTRTFRKVMTSYCQREEPEIAEGMASLLCHDVSTAKKYYDISKAMTSAKRTQFNIAKVMSAKKHRTEPPTEINAGGNLEDVRSTTTSPATTSITSPATTTTTTKMETGSSGADFNLTAFLGKLKLQKLSPKLKFKSIFEKFGPINIPFETLALCLTPSQLKNGRARLKKTFLNASALFKAQRKKYQETE